MKTNIDFASDALILLFRSHYESGIGERPSKEEVEFILSQLFDASPESDVHLTGVMYGVGYDSGGSPPYAMIHITDEERGRIGSKLNGKTVTIIPTKNLK